MWIINGPITLSIAVESDYVIAVVANYNPDMALANDFFQRHNKIIRKSGSSAMGMVLRVRHLTLVTWRNPESGASDR